MFGIYIYIFLRTCDMFYVLHVKFDVATINIFFSFLFILQRKLMIQDKKICSKRTFVVNYLFQNITKSKINLNRFRNLFNYIFNYIYYV